VCSVFIQLSYSSSSDQQQSEIRAAAVKYRGDGVCISTASSAAVDAVTVLQSHAQTIGLLNISRHFLERTSNRSTHNEHSSTAAAVAVAAAAKVAAAANSQ
jgi:hypothetical protein